jgi:hypothetical protein
MGMEKKDQEPPPYTANDGNIADMKPLSAVNVRMVPDFQGESGEGNNQSTDRPKGSV